MATKQKSSVSEEQAKKPGVPGYFKVAGNPTVQYVWPGRTETAREALLRQSTRTDGTPEFKDEDIEQIDPE